MQHPILGELEISGMDFFQVSRVPNIAIHCGTLGRNDDKKLPVGLQILGPHLGEAKLLQIAKAAAM